MEIYCVPIVRRDLREDGRGVASINFVATDFNPLKKNEIIVAENRRFGTYMDRVYDTLVYCGTF